MAETEILTSIECARAIASARPPSIRTVAALAEARPQDAFLVLRAWLRSKT